MNFAARKHVLEYDDVMNKQREVIYAERNRVLDGKDIHGRVEEMMREVVTEGVLTFAPERAYSEEWDWDGLAGWYRELTGMTGLVEKRREDTGNPHELSDVLAEEALAAYARKADELGPENIEELERQVMLRVIDTRWMDHLLEMDYLKEGIGLRAMGQRDPIVEYKSEAYDMFANLVGSIKEDFLRTIMHIEIVREFAPEPVLGDMSYTAPSEASIFTGAVQAADTMGIGGPAPDAIAAAASVAGAGHATQTIVKDKDDPWANVGRNDPCPCGSGKKYKKCHGASV
jgi:preprotein translocase subunit SecA